MVSESTDSSNRTRWTALAGLIAALALAFIAWHYLSLIADAGVDRVERLDAVRTWCSEKYHQALTRDDTLRIDRIALPDTIDAKASDPVDHCGDLRALNALEPPNNREMTGKEMPRGLR